jgi:filamentous hemagglutinin
MSNTLLIKRSSTPGAVPATGDLSYGELAINTFDGKLYAKINDGSPSVLNLSKNQTIIANGNVTGTSVDNASNSTITLTLTTTGVAAGTYGGSSGSSANVGVFQVDQYGRIVSASNVAISTSSLSNGNSNIGINANGNITVSVGGVANVAVFTTAGISLTGNVSGGNVLTDNLLHANGTPWDFQLPAGANTQIQFNLNGDFGASSAFTFNEATNALSVGGTASVSGNVTGGNVSTAGLITATGNITGGNILTGGLISATSTITSSATVTGGNLATGGTASATGNITGGNILTGGLISATSTITSSANITGGNILTGGLISATATVTGGNLATAGTASAGGNVTGGNILTGGLVSATGNITGGNLLTGGLVSATGNITGNYFIGNGSQLTGVTASSVSANALTGNTLSSNVTFSSLTSVGTLSSLSVSGNTTSGNLLTGGLVSATGNIIGGNVNTGKVQPISGALTLGTLGNANINIQPNGTGNIVLNATYINALADPVQNQDAATKIYVDNLVATGLSYHTAVLAATTTTLAVATGGTVTYSQPNGAGNGVGALLTTTGSFNLIDTANVQTVGTRILVKNEANAVHNGIYTWANATNIVRSSDADTYGASASDHLSLNDYFFVTGGSTNEGSAWVVDAPTGVITFGTSNIAFAQFSSSQVYDANTQAGLVLNATTFSAKVDGVTTAFDGGGNITVKASANLTTPNIGAATGTSLSVTGAVTGSTVSATGNITGGNVSTAGLITATGNVTGGNLITAGLATVTGNVTGGNLITAGLVSATGNVATGANLIASGYATVTGNVTGGNILTGGLISATANITGGNIVTVGTGSIATLVVSTLANITATTNATSNITGALKVAGGVGVKGNVYADGMYVFGDSVLTVNSTIDGGTY